MECAHGIASQALGVASGSSAKPENNTAIGSLHSCSTPRPHLKRHGQQQVAPLSRHHVVWGDIESSSSEDSVSFSEKKRILTTDGVAHMETSSSRSSILSGIEPTNIDEPNFAAQLKTVSLKSQRRAAPDAEPKLRSIAGVSYFSNSHDDGWHAGIPLDGRGSLTSIGSIDHAFKSCTPCHYHASPDGCARGVYCKFCHFEHKHRKSRPCKAQRLRFRKQLERLKVEAEHVADEIDLDQLNLPPAIVVDADRKEKLIYELVEHSNAVRALRVGDQWSVAQNLTVLSP